MEFSMKYKIEIVQRLKQGFQGKGISEIIKLSHKEFGDDLGMTTAFGYGGMVLMSFVKDTLPDLPIYFIDTRFHFEETLKLAEKIKKEWKLNIIYISTQYSEEELEKIIGKEAYKTNPDICCQYRKVEPLLRIFKKKKAWLSSIRMDQSRTRSKIDIIEIDGRGTIKINPMHNWTKDQTWMYIRKLDLPYNPLHDQYYPSIGCQPCTAPVDKGGDERDGRWKGFQKMECGIHLHDDQQVEDK